MHQVEEFHGSIPSDKTKEFALRHASDYANFLSELTICTCGKILLVAFYSGMSHVHTPPNARESDAGIDLNGHVSEIVANWKRRQKPRISRRLTIVIYDDGTRFNQVEADDKVIRHGQFV